MPAKRRIITVADLPAGPEGAEFRVPYDAVLTPLAWEEAARRGLKVREVPEAEAAAPAAPARTIALAADHGGFAMKQYLKPLLQDMGYALKDFGVHEDKPADYPDLALAAARAVAAGEAACGIIIDGAGIGSCMVANKVPGVRAALCYDKATARNSREHNNANVLTLGGRLLPFELAAEVAALWLNTRFAGGRHQKRVDKIDALDKRK
jgi:ribose 5-phosphate isomerase B